MREVVADKMQRAEGGESVEIELEGGDVVTGVVGVDSMSSGGLSRFELEDIDLNRDEVMVYIYHGSTRKPSLYDDSDGYMGEKLGVVVGVELVSEE